MRQRTTLPMVLDEVITDVPAFLRAFHAGGMEAINLKISKLGGLTRARQIRELAETLGIRLTIEDTWGGDLVTAAVSHLAASVLPDALFTVSFMNDWTNEHVAGYEPRSQRRRRCRAAGRRPRRRGRSRHARRAALQLRGVSACGIHGARREARAARHAARAVLRPRVRVRDHAGDRLHRRRPDVDAPARGGSRSSPCSGGRGSRTPGSATRPARTRARCASCCSQRWARCWCVSLAVPGAFGDDGLVFGVAYLGVRVLHLVGYAVVARGDPAAARARDPAREHDGSGGVAARARGLPRRRAASRVLDRCAGGRLRRPRAARNRGVARAAGALRRAPRADHHHRPRRVDRLARRRRGRPRPRRERDRLRAARRRGRGDRSGGPTSTSSRSRPSAGCRRPTPSPGRASRATPTPTCTSRWSRASSCSRLA